MLTAKQVKSQLTTDDIVKLCCHLQETDGCLYDAQSHPIFNTCICHGGDSDKLYYYPETQLFHCYTCGSSYDVFELLHRFKGWELPESIRFLKKFFNIEDDGTEESTPELTDDWDIFQEIEDYDKRGNIDNSITPIQSNMIEYFYPLAAPTEWEKEGIKPEVMKHYGIRVDSALQKIIIPHRDIDGNLIGIRGRSFNPIEVAEGKKYMPVFIEGEIYAHPLGKNLFGLYENKETIKRLRRVCVFEAEKSVMQIASMYGIDNCFAVATCGSSLSFAQIELLLKLGVTELILAFDADQEGKRGEPDSVEYEKKLFKIVENYLPYMNISIIFDYDHILPERKMSPSDAGKEIFERLYHNRIKLTSVMKSRK